MKRILVFLGIVLLGGFNSLSVLAGFDADTVKTKSKKEIRAAEREKEYRSVLRLVNSRRFVLEADYIYNQYGDRIPVSPTINFIMLDSAQIVMQYGSGTGVGANGVGGATAAGRVTRWEMNANDRKQTIDIRISAHTPIGSYDIYLYTGGSGRATARVTGLRPGQLNYDGRLVPLQVSKVYKGQHL